MGRWKKILSAGTLLAPVTAFAHEYVPPAASDWLSARLDVTAAIPVDADYQREFVACDGSGPGQDRFRGVDLHMKGVPHDRQFYLCSTDPSNLRALLKLPDGAIYWDSKMALDIDGSWAAWSGLPGTTGLKHTAYTWPGARDRAARAAQIDPDRIPYVVIPTDGKKALTGEAAPSLGREFARKTGLAMGDMGVVVLGKRWTPVLLADGGPFMRVGEASSRVFTALGVDRCRKWNSDRTTCVGPGGVFPYRNSGISGQVLFVLYPGSRDPGLSPANALARLCAFARRKLGLLGGDACP